MCANPRGRDDQLRHDAVQAFDFPVEKQASVPQAWATIYRRLAGCSRQRFSRLSVLLVYAVVPVIWTGG